MEESKKIILIGGGGHSKVIIDIINKRKRFLDDSIYIMGILDDKYPDVTDVLGVPVIGKVNDAETIVARDRDVRFVISIGDNKTRFNIADKLSSLNYYSPIHPNAIIGQDVNIGEGSVIMAGAIINSGASIGKHCIVNTASVIEHDNKMGDYVHISPGVTLSGFVEIGDYTHLGTGSTVINNITIGERVIIGAGATVINNIPSAVTAVGIPAKVIKGDN